MTYTIRPTQPDDVPILANYWYDKMALVQQYNQHVQLTTDACNSWQILAQQWLTEYPELCFSAIAENTRLIGAVMGAILPNEVGFLPSHVGFVRAFVMDLHPPQAHMGLGRQLITQLQHRLREENITELRLAHWGGWLVETAFWQALGAKPYNEQYRIQL